MTLLGKDFYCANFKLLTLMTKYCSYSKFLDKHFKKSRWFTCQHVEIYLVLTVVSICVFVGHAKIF